MWNQWPPLPVVTGTTYPTGQVQTNPAPAIVPPLPVNPPPSGTSSAPSGFVGPVLPQPESQNVNYGAYAMPPYSSVSADQQNAIQQHWQQWQKYQQDYQKWHAQYGEQYNREMAKAANYGISGATSYQNYQQPVPVNMNMPNSIQTQQMDPLMQTQSHLYNRPPPTLPTDANTLANKFSQPPPSYQLPVPTPVPAPVPCPVPPPAVAPAVAPVPPPAVAPVPPPALPPAPSPNITNQQQYSSNILTNNQVDSTRFPTNQHNGDAVQAQSLNEQRSFNTNYNNFVNNPHKSDMDMKTKNDAIQGIEQAPSQDALANNSSKSAGVDIEAFDQQFKQWEEQFEQWKKANYRKLDAEMFYRQESEFEKQRKRLIERREQILNKKRKHNDSPSSAISNSDSFNDSVKSRKISNDFNKLNTNMHEMETNAMKRSFGGGIIEIESVKIIPPLLNPNSNPNANNDSFEKSLMKGNNDQMNIFARHDQIPGLDLVASEATDKHGSGRSNFEKSNAHNFSRASVDNEAFRKSPRPPELQANSNKIPSLFDVIIKPPGVNFNTLQKGCDDAANQTATGDKNNFSNAEEHNVAEGNHFQRRSYDQLRPNHNPSRNPFSTEPLNMNSRSSLSNAFEQNRGERHEARGSFGPNNRNRNNIATDSRNMGRRQNQDSFRDERNWKGNNKRNGLGFQTSKVIDYHHQSRSGSNNHNNNNKFSQMNQFYADEFKPATTIDYGHFSTRNKNDFNNRDSNVSGGGTGGDRRRGFPGRNQNHQGRENPGFQNRRGNNQMDNNFRGRSQKGGQNANPTVDEGNKRSESSPLSSISPKSLHDENDDNENLVEIVPAEDKPEIINDEQIAAKTKEPNDENTVGVDFIVSESKRVARPQKICIILRGPPGSGKSYMAKLIKEKELEMGNSHVRILSIDDYFIIENEYDETCQITGKKVTKKELLYEYDKDMENTYLQYLIKAFRKTITDDLYNLIIVDCNNDSLKSLNEFYNHSKDSGYMPYVVDLNSPAEKCLNQNIHERTLEDIEEVIAKWQATPEHYIKLDTSALLQSPVKATTNETSEVPVCSESTDEPEKQETQTHGFIKSKWENDISTESLARLDGTNKMPSHRKETSMEDFLQYNEWDEPATASNGKKRVRWADIEEMRKQKKMREIGFVVGQTNWKQMMDPNAGNRALTKTKYIERI